MGATGAQQMRDAVRERFGEDVAPGGVFKATPDLASRFGPDRVFDTPISELALAGAAYGAAVTGLRELAAGRAGLLAQVAGIFEGASAGRHDEPLARQAAALCRLAGADGGPLGARGDRGSPSDEGDGLQGHLFD